MKFAEDNQDEGYVITAYDSTNIVINGKSFTQSLIIAGNQMNDSWGVDSISTLTNEHVDTILSFKPELILIGTGSSLTFPAVEAYAPIISAGIGIDFMDTGAACRTYNILMGEGRGVVAGLIL
jgi:uncharacterized protein